MLKMGFIEDIETILKATPDSRQVALFSANMPPPIKRIAHAHLRNPVEVRIAAKTTTATNDRQRYWLVAGMHKLDALNRLLEAQTLPGMLISVSHKAAHGTLADQHPAPGSHT